MRHTIFVAASAALAASATARPVLPANPGPANNGGSPGWAIFFDVQSSAPGVTITEMTTANTGAAGSAFSVEVFRRVGTALGGPVGAGPGSSPAGWVSLGTAAATQGATAGGISLSINIPDIALNAGELTGIAVQFTGVGPRYFGTGTPPYSVFNDGTLSLTTGDARSAPFTPGGSFFTSRALVGELTYVIPTPGAATLFAIAGLACVRRRR